MMNVPVAVLGRIGGAPAPVAAWITDGSTTGSAASIVYTIAGAGIAATSLAIIAGGSADGSTVSSVTDSKGNTWAVDKTIGNGAHCGVGIASSYLTAALLTGDTITVNFAGGNGRAVACGYYGIPTNSTPLDKTASATGSSATPTATTAATTQTKELVIGVVSTDGINDFTQDGAYTTVVANIGIPKMTIGEKVTGATGAQTYAPTCTSQQWALAIATYKVN